MEVKALMLDTHAIQRYIFSGTLLRTNIGASYIVEHIFDDILIQQVLQPHFGKQLDAESWQHPETSDIGSRLDQACQIAYIGGGKALLLLRMDTPDGIEKAIVTQFTTLLLTKYPGLRTGAAFGLVKGDSPEVFKKTLDDVLQSKLRLNQNQIFPQVNPTYTGLTLRCPVNGETADFYATSGQISKSGGNRFFSQETAAKNRAALPANKALQQKFSAVMDSYVFPMELDKLGQKEAEAYIAIVHIDGNQMGKRFSSCQSLAAQSVLSQTVRNKVQFVFTALLADIVSEYSSYTGWLDLQAQEGESLLPIRPLILGGDDVTFVCNARLAVTYAQRFMKYMQQSDIGGMVLDCCCGIAIQPTAYPFFRGYELAEQACSAAKGKSRHKEGSCWLDFVIRHGEQAPELEQIREEEYTGANGEVGAMHFGPYQVGGQSSHLSLEKLIFCSQELHRQPKNKVKELRNVLSLSDHFQQRFLEQVRHHQQQLPNIAGWECYAEHLWHEGRTPYVDAIELMDFMPPVKEEK